jgi:hypothetical protein
MSRLEVVVALFEIPQGGHVLVSDHEVEIRHAYRADLACFVGTLQIAVVVSGTVAAWASSAGG